MRGDIGGTRRGGKVRCIRADDGRTLGDRGATDTSALPMRIVNRDGRIDEWTFYENGEVERTEFDTDSDGKVDAVWE
jgi:hypothetical protein